MSESEPCIPCNKEEGEVTEDTSVGATPRPICEKCQQNIEISQDYEDYAGHFVHTKCMEEALLAIILTAPSLEEIKQLKEAREQMKQMQAMLKDPNMLSKLVGARVNFSDDSRNFPLWEESDESKDANR
jgi:hypothetical protein